MLSVEEEITLTKRIKEGDTNAANKLVQANLRFVVSVAKQYQNRGLSLGDLVQEGNLGMIKAAYKFDETRGFKFISYAVWWIRQEILQALQSQCRTIRLPMSQSVSLSKINNATEEFEKQYGRKPSEEELESMLDIPADKIAFTIASASRSVSLETPFKDEEAGCLLDIMPNSNAEEADENLVKTGVSSQIQEVLDNLSPRESDVIRMNFGLGVPPMSHEEIASRFGIGCERVRQIQHEAIDKIKSNYKDILRELL